MERYIEFIVNLQNNGFWLVKVRPQFRDAFDVEGKVELQCLMARTAGRDLENSSCCFISAASKKHRCKLPRRAPHLHRQERASRSTLLHHPSLRLETGTDTEWT